MRGYKIKRQVTIDMEDIKFDAGAMSTSNWKNVVDGLCEYLSVICLDATTSSLRKFCVEIFEYLHSYNFISLNADVLKGTYGIEESKGHFEIEVGGLAKYQMVRELKEYIEEDYPTPVDEWVNMFKNFVTTTIEDGYVSFYCEEVVKVDRPKQESIFEQMSMTEALVKVGQRDAGLYRGSNLLASWSDLRISGEIKTEGSCLKKVSDLVGELVVESSITEIGTDAFMGCGRLFSVVLPDGIEKIGHYAFYGCSQLNYLNIPESVEEIGHFAFTNCPNLKDIVLPANLKFKGNGV